MWKGLVSVLKENTNKYKYIIMPLNRFLKKKSYSFQFVNNLEIVLSEKLNSHYLK